MRKFIDNLSRTICWGRAFLVAILERKLNIAVKQYNDDLVRFENYSLLALASLYGIELLEDNAQTCVLNMFQAYYETYQEQVKIHNGKMRKKCWIVLKRSFHLI